MRLCGCPGDIKPSNRFIWMTAIYTSWESNLIGVYLTFGFTRVTKGDLFIDIGIRALAEEFVTGKIAQELSCGFTQKGEKEITYPQQVSVADGLF